jgi:hypothetical protein
MMAISLAFCWLPSSWRSSFLSMPIHPVDKTGDAVIKNFFIVLILCAPCCFAEKNQTATPLQNSF